MKSILFIKPKSFFKIILIIVLFTGFQSCIKDKFDFDRLAQVEYEPTVAGPVLHTKLTLWDVLNDWDSSHLFVQGEDHFLTLIYRGTVFSQTAENLIRIPNQTFPQYDTIFNNPGVQTIELVFPMYFGSQNGEILDEIYIKQGTWNFNFATNLMAGAQITTTFPTITRISDGSPLVVVNTVASGSQSVVNQRDLAGYKIVLTHPSPTTNSISCNIQVTFASSTPTNGNSLILNSDIQNMLYSKLIGYFGQPAFDILKDTIFLDVFKRNLSGRFSVYEPKLNIFVSNSYGFPINIIFDRFATYRSVPPLDSVPISGSGFTNPWSIISPSLAQAGQTMVSSLLLDKTTSNIDDAINISPQYLIHHTRALGNPAGNTGAKNFVLDTSKFKVDVDVELPIWGRAIDFTVQDTFKIDEFKLENKDKIDWAAVRVTTTNGYPVDVKLQLIFCDTLYNRWDSLYLNNDDNQIISSGILGPGPDYKVIMPFIKKTETLMSGARVNNMINHQVRKVLLKAVLNTSQNHGVDVKFYSDYTIDIKIGIKTHLKIKY